MQTGFVFKVSPAFFGILTSGRTTNVLLRTLPDAETVADAIEALSRSHAGRFLPADSDQEKWGRTIVKSQIATEVLTG